MGEVKRQRASQMHGAAFEAWLEAQHLIAFRRGIAHVRKVSPAVKWLAGGRAIVTGAAGCDWSGTLKGGRHLVAESKSTATARLGLSAFESHQIADLDLAHHFGALALAIIELRVDGRPLRFAAPWPLPWRVTGNGQGVGVDELRPWAIVEGSCYLARFVYQEDGTEEVP